jgi:hypothetical protein
MRFGLGFRAIEHGTAIILVITTMKPNGSPAHPGGVV